MARIVVVDDDDLIRLTVTRVLRARGHEVLEAVNGLDGFNLIQRCEPALVISDVNMPGEDGFSMLERLRAQENTRTLPVVMLTSLDDRGSFRRGMTLGADDYLPKPFSRDELLAAVDARLEKADALTRRLEAQLAQREQALREQFARRLQGRVDTESMASQSLTGVAEQALTGVVLQAEIRNFTGFAERLTSAELADLLSEFLGRASDVLHQWGGEQLCFEGEGLLAVFPAKQTDHALRAGRAALELALVARALRDKQGSGRATRWAMPPPPVRHYAECLGRTPCLARCVRFRSPGARWRSRRLNCGLYRGYGPIAARVRPTVVQPCWMPCARMRVPPPGP